jgi:hypothetical protein
VRVIASALLLANLLYMGWAQWIDVPAPPPQSSIAGLPRLTLISDLPPAKRAALASKTSLETPVQQCVSVGPFDDPAVAAKAATVLQAKSFASKQRTAQSPAVRRFWVYLDGFRSDATEMRVLHRLERAGIDDAEAMPADAGGLKVSLGLFTDHDRAVSRAKVVHAMGFKPVMTERMLPGTVYWLDLTLASGSTPVPLKDVSDLEPNGGSSPISVRPCSSTPPPAAPSPQTASPASPPVTQTAPIRQTAARPSSSAPVLNLPRCKSGGGGPVPCVASEKATGDPSVL